MNEQNPVESMRKDILTVVECLWADEERHYEEGGRPSGHVFEALRRLKKWAQTGPGRVPADAISSPAAAAALFFAELPAEQNEERVFVLPLSETGRVLAKPILVSVGRGRDSAAIDVGAVFREALTAGAEEIIVAHNHPSGRLRPSKEDIAATAKLLDAAKLLNTPLLDHLILGRDANGTPCHFSFAEYGIEV
jgi:DNA repair protein RadC